MVSGIEGAGDAITGGLLARAVEPATGEAESGEGNCLNCGAELAGAYCHRCGQKGHVHRTLGAFWHDLLHSVLHFDGKLWRTLPLLAWKPGELTRRYVAGERARFVSPMALFLFSVFLMFAVFATIGGPFTFTGSPQASQEALRDLNREQQAYQQRADALGRERAALVAAGRPTAPLDARIAAIRHEQQTLRAAQRLIGAPAAPGAPGEENKGVLDLEGTRVDTGWPTLDHALEKAARNPSLLAYKLQTNAYKFSWALIPISVPFVWLMFAWKRRFKAYDHMVFVTYSIAAITLLMVLLSLIRAGLGSAALSGLAIAFVPPIHMFRQLKGAYGLRTFSALWRTVFLLWFAFLSAAIFFLLLLALGVLG